MTIIIDSDSVVSDPGQGVQALSIIRPALRKIGAIDALEQPNAEQTAVALECLNGIIDTWQVSTAMATNNNEYTVTLAANSPTMTIGPGLTVDAPRPFKIESAYARLQNVDRPIQVADKAQYDAVNLKNMGTSWPELVWYDGNYPTGNLHFWPLVNTATEIHITLLNYLTLWAKATDRQYLPQGYRRALTLCLAVEVAPEFDLEPSASLVRQSALAYKALARANTVVPDMTSEVRVTSRLGQFLGGGF